MDDCYGGRLRNFWTFQNLRSIMRRAAGHGNAGEGCCSAHSMFGEWRLEQRRMFEIPVTWHILKHSQITVSPNSQMCERSLRSDTCLTSKWKQMVNTLNLLIFGLLECPWIYGSYYLSSPSLDHNYHFVLEKEYCTNESLWACQRK